MNTTNDRSTERKKEKETQDTKSGKFPHHTTLTTGEFFLHPIIYMGQNKQNMEAKLECFSSSRPINTPKKSTGRKQDHPQNLTPITKSYPMLPPQCCWSHPVTAFIIYLPVTH